MPDIFVPEDTAENTMLLQELANAQLFTAYVVDRLQPAMKKFTSEDAFLKQYTITDQELSDFIVYSSQTIKEMDSREILISKPYLKTLLKSFAARFKWGDDGYYKALNGADKTLEAAIAAIK